MRNLLPVSSFVTTAPANGIADLTRGQLACIDSNGVWISDASQITKGSTIKFYVGLGNGLAKSGVVINPFDHYLKVAYTPYKAAAAEVWTVTGITSQVGFANRGKAAIVVITVPSPNYLFRYPNYPRDIIVEYDDPNESAADFVLRVEAEINRQVDALNKMYGRNIVTFASTGGNWTFTGEPGMPFEVHIEGLLRATSVESNVTGATGGVDTTSNGTGAEVAQLEKQYSIESNGYNPNYRAWQEGYLYGDLNIADAGLNYNIYVIRSRSAYTHVFDMNSQGMEVTQLLALDTAGTWTALEALMDSLQTIANSSGAIVAAATPTP